MARQSQAQPQALPAQPVLLLTRPAPQAARFAAEVVAALGPLRVILSPLLAPQFHSPPIPDRPFQAVILASETAVAASKRISAPLPRRAYTVGDRTAAAALAAGFDPISADGDAQALIALIRAQPNPGPLLHLRGAESRGDIAETLNSAGIETVSVVLYTQIPQPLTDEAHQALIGATPLLLPLFSVNSALELLRNLPDPCPAPLWIAAISPAVAEILPPGRAQRLAVAGHPDARSMVDCLVNLCAARPLP